MDTTIAGILARCTEDPRILGVWVEGETPEAARPSGERIRLHLATQDPDFDGVWSDHETLLRASGDLQSHNDGDTEPFARRCEARFASGTIVEMTLERMSLLGKRPRAYVRPLDDKTHGRLRTAFDYSARS